MKILVKDGRVQNAYRGNVTLIAGRISDDTGHEYGHGLDPSMQLIAVPEQELPKSKLNGEDAPAVFDACYPEDVTLYSVAEQAQLIDRETGKVIDKATHPFAGTDEALGILRDQMVQWGNALGLEFTPDFARLNEIAIAAIEVSAAKKGAL